MATMTKQVKTITGTFSYNQVATTLKNQKLQQMYDAGLTDGFCDGFNRFVLGNNYYNVSTRYFVDAASAQDWADWFMALSNEYNLGVVSTTVEGYIPDGTGTISIDGPTEWNVNYSPPPT